MKAQILSRIQSYHNIPININTNNNYNCLTNTQSYKIINQAKFIKYAVNVRDSPQGNIKILSPSTKVNSHRMLLSTAAIISSKKKLSSTLNKDIKRSVNLGNQTAQKINDYWNIKNSNKINNKQIINKNRQLQTNLRGSQNQPNKINIQKQKCNTNYILSKCQNMQTKKLSRQLFKQTIKNNITRKKDLMRIYSKLDINKDIIGIQSDKNITIVKQQNQVKDPQKQNKNHIMTKVSNVLKDQKQILYLGLSSKKFNIRSSQKQIQLKSDNRILINTLIQKQKQQDISIEMSIQQNYKQNQDVIQNQYLQFGCSQIKQRDIENDSSFLESVQKNAINQIQQNNEISCTKKKWKKLPNDFLKI